MNHNGYQVLCVDLEFARQIERERNEAREDVMKLQDIKRKHEHEELAAAQENDRLKRQRDEARAVANDLASAASHCLGWHDCRLNIGEKIAATLQRWSKLKEAVK
jgi:hypothetical protein